MPITAIRRPLTITAWLVMSILCLILSPLLLALAWIASAIGKRPQPLMLARLLIAYFSRELAVIVACGALWLASGAGIRMRSRRFQLLHFRLLRWFIGGLADRALALLHSEVAPEEDSEEAVAALRANRPLLFFSRHAGPGDTVLLVDQLMRRYDRLPSVVFKETLALDPCVDLIGHRLPQALLDTDDREECETRIKQVSAELGDRGVLLLFPEGANFTFERRRSALRKLATNGRRREASKASEMSHVLPPHPTGALAALAANPNADVIFGAHTGLGLAAFPGQLWRDTPIGRTFRTRMWVAPGGERPTDPEEQTQWLYDWWKRIDRWIDESGGEPRAGTEDAGGGEPRAGAEDAARRDPGAS